MFIRSDGRTGSLIVPPNNELDVGGVGLLAGILRIFLNSIGSAGFKVEAALHE